MEASSQVLFGVSAEAFMGLLIGRMLEVAFGYFDTLVQGDNIAQVFLITCAQLTANAISFIEYMRYAEAYYWAPPDDVKGLTFFLCLWTSQDQLRARLRSLHTFVANKLAPKSTARAIKIIGGGSGSPFPSQASNTGAGSDPSGTCNTSTCDAVQPLDAGSAGTK